MSSPDNPICVAIDTPDTARAFQLVQELAGSVGMIKIGMEFYYANGVAGYEKLAGLGIPVFLDLKLHDIPNTVAAGLTSLLSLQPTPAIINVHATGGPAMLAAAARAMNGKAKLIAVTILTSLDDNDLAAAGFDQSQSTLQHAVGLAKLARDNGADGVVCSPHDLREIRKTCGDDFITVVPGIRPAGAAVHDQKRIATPKSALEAGADILVIGRAITGADQPAKAAQEILQSLEL